MNGFFLVDKPVGVTSHDVVRQIKYRFKLDKVGHTGTLDPFASGLLIVCVGKATKLSELLTSSDKSYTGTIVFGKHYDTYDTTGKVVNEIDVSLTSEKVSRAMQTFIGQYEQEPPMHSAIKIDGQKLYHLARQGKSIVRKLRLVNIYRFDMLSYKQQEVTFNVTVSKGTYIRSLAVDLATKLNTYGALSALRRTMIGHYDVNHAKAPDDLVLDDMIELTSFFDDYPSIILNDYMVHLVKNGIVLDERQTTIKEPFVVRNEAGECIAYYEPHEANTYRPILIL